MKPEKEHQKVIIEKIWPRVKRKHLFPEIPIPRIGEEADFPKGGTGENEGVGLEMKEKQMILNSAFLSRLKDQIPEEQAIEALLDHGITHYTFCPWDFHTHVQLYAEAKKVVNDKLLAKRVANYFIDVVADTYCVKKRTTDIPELRRSLPKGKVDQVIASLYQRIWGIDLGIPVTGWPWGWSMKKWFDGWLGFLIWIAPGGVIAFRSLPGPSNPS